MDRMDEDSGDETEIYVGSDLDTVYIIVQFVTDEGPEMIRIALDSQGAYCLATGILKARNESDEYMEEAFGVKRIEVATISEKE